VAILQTHVEGYKMATETEQDELEELSPSKLGKKE